MGTRRTARTPLTLLATALIGVGACADAPAGPAAGEFEPDVPGVLTVATSLPAPGFWDGENGDGGFEHGLASALLDRFGLDELRLIDVPFESIVRGDLGGADIALAQITPTPARDEVLDFTTAYLDANPAVIVRPGTDVADLAAARELTWVVQASTTSTDLVHDVVRPDTAAIEVADIDAVLEAVGSGSVDAGLLDLPTALVAAERSGGRLMVAAQFDSEDGLAIAVTDGDANLEALDSAVRAMLSDGTIDSLAEEFLARDVSDTVVGVPLIRYQPVAP